MSTPKRVRLGVKRAPDPARRGCPLKYAVDRETGCWVWVGALDSDGYPQLRVDGRRVRAYRAYYEAWWRPLLPGEEVDHTCRNRRCVNPAHLEAVSHRSNMIRMSWWLYYDRPAVVRILAAHAEGLPLAQVAERCEVAPGDVLYAVRAFGERKAQA